MYTFIPVDSKKDKILSNARQFLAIDAVKAANAGHPGFPMGIADIVEVLWRNYLRHNPKDPAWPNRDRSVLSNGHGSMLLYGLLHLTGYDLHQRDLFGFNFERVIELARSVVERHHRTASAN